jgi:hypothetical protein
LEDGNAIDNSAQCSVLFIVFYFLNADAGKRARKRKKGALHNLGGSLYLSFHQKWRKLGTLLQTYALEAEMKKNVKFLTVYQIIGHNFTVHFAKI